MSAIKKLSSKASRFNIQDNDGGGGKILSRISGSDTPASQLSTEWVALASVQIDPKNPRRLFIDEKRLMMDPMESDDPQEQTVLQELRALANSIREDGLANPIEVFTLPGDGYRIISGERRYWASLYNLRAATPEERFKYENVRVTIYREPPRRLRRKQLTENSLRAKLPMPDHLHSIRAAFEESQQAGAKLKTAVEFGQELGLPYHDAKLWFAVITRWPGLQQLLANGQISAMYHLRQILALEDDKVSKLVPKIAQYGFSTELLEEAGGEVMTAKPPATPPQKAQRGRPKLFLTRAPITTTGAQKIYDALQERLGLGPVDWNDPKSAKKAFDALIKAINA